MMSMITVDGCDYEVEHTSGITNYESIAVWTKDDELLADAVVHHGQEFVNVTYHHPEHGDWSTHISYHEYTTPEELARWLVATYE
jgi:hypothetical protein